MKNETLKCVVTLAVIAVVCGLLLSVFNALLYVAPSLTDLSDSCAGEWVKVDLNTNYSKTTGIPMPTESFPAQKSPYISINRLLP